MTYGGVEAGGTKWVCGIGTGPDDLHALEVIPTTTPSETLGRAAEFFTQNGGVSAVGVGSFGPIDHRSGQITTTPKPGWANTDVVAALHGALGVPVSFDTDVNAAALGEQRWGAAKGLDTFCYITVGTGIGGGVMAGGQLVHGLTHPELGHMRVPHDTTRDPFEGMCPFHGDCFEGLASGSAMRARWGAPAETIVDPQAWELEAEYLALGLANVTTIVSPQLIVLGGGVPKQPGLIPRVRELLDEVLAGYVVAPDVVAPALGDRAGVLGAIELARLAA
ncbi:MAG: fructokinase [Streptomyces sp.]|jgi:fructokinase|nr:fructokinase [Streptomyces sp.]